MLIQLTEEQRDALLSLVAEGPISAKAIDLAEALNTPFTPKLFIGLQGGLVQGATANCDIDYVVADHDTDGTDGGDDIVFLPTWDTEVVISDPGILVDPAVCEALFAQAAARDEKDGKDK